MIVMIDNYDSFTYNLVQYIRQIGEEVRVFRNDAVTLKKISDLKPFAIIISPGPGLPGSAGISLDVVKTFSGKIPILGVCLGHQTIASSFGSNIIPAKKIMHGKTSQISCDGKSIYQGFKKPFQAMRYHSLAVQKESLPDCLVITATSDDGEIMGIRHISHNTEGIQFHPESIMTTSGKRLLRNFINHIHKKK
ncbi:MAG: aminodeoxychorismate/anthranilate synthase component II [Desulfobacula sp.]|uniref:anthranilate synthase component II n=1 Tax=Desulfobacula sp. TaxID=2593537 RepID=UPI0025BE305E|nr:aminodeoxychorismate/anthranilate synthase component II [Desulfobacula sp.]MCD4718292.1 aminodeoxychorismate/anthranilate synthase component II [Desulfobacula sp.]